MSRAVVFDVGNVLIRWDPRLVFRELFADEAAMEAFLEDTDFNAWNLEQDRGRSWADGLAVMRAAHPEAAERYETFAREWQRSVPGPIEGTVAILRRLQEAGITTHALTNFSAEKWAECQERFDFLANGFETVVVSAHEKLVKPDPAIFGVLCERAGADTETLIFVDDSPRNVEAAEGIGIDAILFEGPERLAEALRERGLPA